MRINLPALTEATSYTDYVNQLVACNPSMFLPIGVKRTWLDVLKGKMEHPLTRR